MTSPTRTCEYCNADLSEAHGLRRYCNRTHATKAYEFRKGWRAALAAVTELAAA